MLRVGELAREWPRFAYLQRLVSDCYFGHKDGARRKQSSSLEFLRLFGSKRHPLGCRAAEVLPVLANLFAKVLIFPRFFVILHPYLTKVDSRHDSTNHASMFLDEPSGKAERVLAAPEIRMV